MPYELRDNSGNAFKRERKTDKHPSYTGQVMVNGTTMDIACWVREDRNKNKFLSFKFQPPRDEMDQTPEDDDLV